MRPMSLGTGWGGQVCCEGVRGRDPGRTRTRWWQGATRPLVVPSAMTSPGSAQWGLRPGALKQHLCAGLASLKGNWERKPGEGKRCVPLPLQPPTQMAGPLFAQPLLGKPRRLSSPSRGSGPGHPTSIWPGTALEAVTCSLPENSGNGNRKLPPAPIPTPDLEVGLRDSDSGEKAAGSERCHVHL